MITNPKGTIRFCTASQNSMGGYNKNTAFKGPGCRVSNELGQKMDPLGGATYRIVRGVPSKYFGVYKKKKGASYESR